MKTDTSKCILADLAATLTRIAHEYGISYEQLQAERLLADSRHTWPGDPDKMWLKWLAEGVSTIGLSARIAHMSVAKALDLVEDGALVACKPAGIDGTALVLDFDGRHVQVASGGTDERLLITDVEMTELIQSNAKAGEVGLEVEWDWVVVERLQIAEHGVHAFHGRPVSRLVALLRPERSDIWVVGVFAFFAGVLSLATPIAVESLVNIVAFGRLIQPLVILSLMLFGFLVFASLMKALQTFVVEIIQRRLFARVVADLAYRFPRVRSESLEGHYGPELANRFFDIVTLQKVVAQLLLDGIAIVLATFVGMAVLAFYHPWLLGFDVLLLSLIVGGVLILGRGAIGYGIDESRQKYRVAAWLEDLLRCPVSFKSAGAPEFALDRANQMTADYIGARKRHFHVLFRQLLFILGLQAVAGTVLLGFGGWLVIQGQLTLGQLVAAELIVATILGSLAKLGKHIEGFYDVVASVEKLGHLFDLDMEPHDGELAIRGGNGVQLRVTDVQHHLGGPALKHGFSMALEHGDNVALISSAGAGSTLLFDMLYGLREPDSGHLEIEAVDPRDLRPDVLRGVVALVRDIELFEGTIVDNVRMGRADVSMINVRAALAAVGLLDDLLRLPNGLDTKINATGGVLLPTQQRLLMLARAIAARPGLLLIDGVLDALADSQLVHICNLLTDQQHGWTVVVATNRQDVADQFGSVIPLAKTSDIVSKPLLEADGSVEQTV